MDNLQNMPFIPVIHKNWIKFSARLIPDLEFLLPLTDFHKHPITFLKSKGWYSCTVLTATHSTLV